MKEKAELPLSFIQHTPWEGTTQTLWPLTTFTLRRNLAQYLFPAKMAENQMQQIQDIIKKALVGIPLLKNPVFLTADALSASDLELLGEYFLGSGGFQNPQKGQAFLIDDSARFLATINVEDHLHLEMLDTQDTWEPTWNTLISLENALGNAFDYAFSSKFGYLTADPAYCGTALTIASFVHLPALIHLGQLEDLLIKQKDEDVETFGLLGKMDNLIGDILIVRNKYRLGISEESILQAVRATSMKLILAEKALRNHLESNGSTELKDKVSRAYGLLAHSYQLQTAEALDALSMIKLGIDEKWIEGISDQKINTIFFQCRRAHLPYVLNQKNLPNEEIPRKRAEFLHKALADMKLAI